MPSLWSGSVCSREGDWSWKGKKWDGVDGAHTCHRLLCGREAFREGLDLTHRLLQAGLPAPPAGLGVWWSCSPGSLAPKRDLGMSGNHILQAASLLQTCRWKRNSFYTKYSEHCSAEVTVDVPAVRCVGRMSSDMDHGHCHH